MRKFRSDYTIGALERKLGIGNFFKNANGRNTRSDKLLSTFRKDLLKKGK